MFSDIEDIFKSIFKWGRQNEEKHFQNQHPLLLPNSIEAQLCLAKLSGKTLKVLALIQALIWLCRGTQNYH